MTYWQPLAAAADQNHLYLNPEAAAHCSKACDNYIGQLLGHRQQALKLAEVDGWGEFEAGKDIRKIFREKAHGGTNSMVDVLDAHIRVVEEMKVVFNKFSVATTDTDAANAADVQAQGPN